MDISEIRKQADEKMKEYVTGDQLVDEFAKVIAGKSITELQFMVDSRDFLQDNLMTLPQYC
jgi:hypothetical protein